MTQILTVTNVASAIDAVAKDDKYTYRVKYYVYKDSKEPYSLTMAVEDNTTGYVGTVSMNDNQNKSIIIKQTEDVNTINTMFDNIVAEVKTGLATL